eukprot:CAMPEP_0170265722 /NCGR_PEP_ID=MMETSP0116_2-20130129/32768_1 /TAXON_ID=400756 /ORGANISM="Durinskia baltica, Strain CSIRO CS-38" /LENGTH=37 /DNA_ID= /DNA_START= /DNA_END= /DNA_ORIENTATION=
MGTSAAAWRQVRLAEAALDHQRTQPASVPLEGRPYLA